MNKTSSDEGLSLMLGDLSSLREERLKLREERLKLREERLKLREEKLQKLMTLSELDKELSKLQSGRKGSPDTQEAQLGNARKQQSQINWPAYIQEMRRLASVVRAGPHLSPRRRRAIEAQIARVLAKSAAIA